MRRFLSRLYSTGTTGIGARSVDEFRDLRPVERPFELLDELDGPLARGYRLGTELLARPDHAVPLFVALSQRARSEGVEVRVRGTTALTAETIAWPNEGGVVLEDDRATVRNRIRVIRQQDELEALLAETYAAMGRGNGLDAAMIRFLQATVLNALEHANSAAYVAVRAGMPASACVADAGPGVAAKMAERLSAGTTALYAIINGIARGGLYFVASDVRRNPTMAFTVRSGDAQLQLGPGAESETRAEIRKRIPVTGTYTAISMSIPVPDAA